MIGYLASCIIIFLGSCQLGMVKRLLGSDGRVGLHFDNTTCSPHAENITQKTRKHCSQKQSIFSMDQKQNINIKFQASLKLLTSQVSFWELSIPGCLVVVGNYTIPCKIWHQIQALCLKPKAAVRSCNLSVGKKRGRNDSES